MSWEKEVEESSRALVRETESSQTRCHFGSIVLGSYRSTTPPETKKPLAREAVGSRRGVAAFASLIYASSSCMVQEC